jgi:hypothetical protein
MMRGRSEFWGMVFGTSKKEARGAGRMPPNPLADLIAADIEANGGKLIVDPDKFERMRKELEARGIA